MLLHQIDSLQYYTFPSLEGNPHLFHAILTRHGGCSEGQWRSLNLGGSVGDDPDRVRRNKRRALLALNRPPESVADAWQVHGAEVLFATEPRTEAISPQKADIILTDCQGITLVMRFADCVPILLYDPAKQVVGLVHAGWRGTVEQAVKIAVEAMQARYGSSPGTILAGIGPSIGPDHYQVGPDVVRYVRRSFGEAAGELLLIQNGSVHFDLWKANEFLLRQSGVNHIEHSLLCTACNTSDFFSHRAEKGKTGRFGVLVGLKNG